MENIIKSTEKRIEPHFQPPIHLTLFDNVRFWREQSLRNCDDKGGSFNVELYMKILEIKHRNS